jgi:GT2 family glycosyltransferase
VEPTLSSLVSITIVTANDLRYIPGCLGAIFAMDYSPFEVIMVDNNSTDGTREFYAQTHYPIRVEYNSENKGFSAAHNRAIAQARGAWILCLNPDARLTPQFLTELVRAGELSPKIGIVCPKILRMETEGTGGDGPTRLDSTGVYFNRWLRHHDRGSQEIDRGQYETPEYVFGYTGAAVLFRRAMIDDISINGEFMDEDFFLYREDADVSWRAQLLGWHCIYTPYAIGYHVRRVFGDNRGKLPAFINMHSTKNRFLMRIKNITPGVYRKVFFQTTVRDLGVLGYVLLREWSSLAGLSFVIKSWRRTWAKRLWVQSRRRVTDNEIAKWFNDNATAFPLEPELLARLNYRPPFLTPEKSTP